MSSASATRTTPASIVIGSPRRRWPITACSASADHDRPLGLLVDPLEQQRQPVGGQEEAERLVVGAVDRHAGVVEQAAGGDHHLGVAAAHAVVVDHRRLDARRGSSSRNSRSAMLSTIRTWTQEWSDIPSRSAFTCCMCHQAAAAARRRWRRRAAPRACGCRAWGRRSPWPGSSTGGKYAFDTWDARASGRRARTPDHRDLRVSVTDRCNFRCQYCMPADGLPWLEREEILRFEEIERLVRVFAEMGVTDVRLTGRRAARAPRVPAAAGDARADPGRRGPLAHHQRLPARARRRRAGGRRDQAGQRVDRLAPARPLLPA